MQLSHFFIPHPQTHKKAHLISLPAIFIYIVLFLTIQFGLKDLAILRPDILGISSSVDSKELIRLTNTQRQKDGLPSLTENNALDQAAAAKAKNMFAENYWAHYSPSGKDPWSFIINAGYRFSYAGENLARNFHTSQEVVDAWMASPSHKDNIINSHYSDIGIAVSYGKLDGQDTVLIVQEFGSPVEYLAQAKATSISPLASSPAPTFNPTNTPQASQAPVIAAIQQQNPPPLGEVKSHRVIDTFRLVQSLNLGLIIFIAVLMVTDLVILRNRAVVRISSRHWSHFALLAVITSAIASSNRGSVL